MMNNDDIINDYRDGYNVNQLMVKYRLSRHVINDILLDFREEIYLDYLDRYDYQKISTKYGVPLKKVYNIIRGRSLANGDDIAQPRSWQHTRWGAGSVDELISQLKYNIGSIDMVRMILRKNPHLLKNQEVQDILYHAGIKY